MWRNGGYRQQTNKQYVATYPQKSPTCPHKRHADLSSTSIWCPKQAIRSYTSAKEPYMSAQEAHRSIEHIDTPGSPALCMSCASDPLLRKCRAFMRVCRALLWICEGMSTHMSARCFACLAQAAVFCGCGVLVRVYRALLGMCEVFLHIYRLFCGYVRYVGTSIGVPSALYVLRK